MNKKLVIIQFSIAAVSALLLIPFLGQVHLFDWDEINFAESAREMMVSGDYLTVQIGYEPFWEKPPLFIWFQVLSMKLFGINEFAARFPNALCGIITLLILFNIGRRLYNQKFGLLWTMAFGCSILPFFYFKSGIIDPWFNLFIFLGVIFWVFAIESQNSGKKYLYCSLSGLFLGLGLLTKGPVSILVFGLLALLLILINGFRIGLNWKHMALFAVSLIFFGGSWFLLQMVSGNFDIIKDFIVYQVRLFQTKDAGHGGFPLYHFIIVLVGVFPASIFAIQGHRYKGPRDRRKTLHIAMIGLLWIVLILFSMVKTKIIHYSSLTYFPVTYLAAYACYNIINGKSNYRNWQKVLVGIIGSILACTIILLPWIYYNRKLFIEKGYITNPFIIGNLQAETSWSPWISLIGIILIAGMILSYILSGKRKAISLIALYVSTLIFVFLSIVFVTKGAERISQNAAIEFIREKSKEGAYIQTFYKSFAVLFYGKQKPPADKREFDLKWLLNGNIEKDAYFIHRANKKEEVLERYPQIHILYEKNGYVFFVRKAVIN